MRAKVVAAIVLLTLLVIFTIQETHPVVLNFLSWKISTSFLLYILLGFMIGLLTGYLLIMMVRMKKKNPYLDYSCSNVLQFLLARYFESLLMGQAKSLKRK